MEIEKKKILLVDDVRLFLEIEKTFFNRKMFDVKTIHSGKEVLDYLTRELPDLIFMDMFMPDMGGDECCRAIKSDPRLRHIPVIMVTTGGREEDLQRCQAAGCDDVVLKPINRQHFLATTTKFLKVLERSAPRYIASLSIHYGPDVKNLLMDYIVNLSTGGVFLETTQLLPLDTPLIAQFILPHNNMKIRCHAKVVWLNSPPLLKNPNLPVGMGMQFVDISMAEMDAIREYIRTENLVSSW